jgi:hypothetical protein
LGSQVFVSNFLLSDVWTVVEFALIANATGQFDLVIINISVPGDCTVEIDNIDLFKGTEEPTALPEWQSTFWDAFKQEQEARRTDLL